MKTIAVIEDDQHIGDILEKTLKREGYEVLRAYSGTEAVYLLVQMKHQIYSFGFNASGAVRRGAFA